MTPKQRVISLKEFAKAALARDSSFAERVRHFETRFGTVDGDTLAVLAQAAYFCWGENEYQSDLVEVCQAIRIGKPTSLYHCRQITPERWTEMNTYVIGVQRWLGVDLPLPRGIDSGKIGHGKARPFFC